MLFGCSRGVMLETRDGMFLRVSSVQAFTQNVSWESGRGYKNGRSPQESGSTRVQGACFLKTICSASESYIERGVVSENAEYLVIMRGDDSSEPDLWGSFWIHYIPPGFPYNYWERLYRFIGDEKLAWYNALSKVWNSRLIWCGQTSRTRLLCISQIAKSYLSFNNFLEYKGILKITPNRLLTRDTWVASKLKLE